MLWHMYDAADLAHAISQQFALHTTVMRSALMMRLPFIDEIQG